MPTLVIPASRVPSSKNWATILHLDPVGLWIFSGFVSKMILSGYVRWEQKLGKRYSYLSGDLSKRVSNWQQYVFGPQMKRFVLDLSTPPYVNSILQSECATPFHVCCSLPFAS